jgi:hypothetical protein
VVPQLAELQTPVVAAVAEVAQVHLLVTKLVLVAELV